MYIYIYIHTHIHTYIYIYIYTRVYTYNCTYKGRPHEGHAGGHAHPLIHFIDTSLIHFV